MFYVYYQVVAPEAPRHLHGDAPRSGPEAVRTFERLDGTLGTYTLLWVQNAAGEVMLANALYLRLVEGREVAR